MPLQILRITLFHTYSQPSCSLFRYSAIGRFFRVLSGGLIFLSGGVWGVGRGESCWISEMLAKVLFPLFRERASLFLVWRSFVYSPIFRSRLCRCMYKSWKPCFFVGYCPPPGHLSGITYSLLFHSEASSFNFKVEVEAVQQERMIPLVRPTDGEF